jgi:hypothetical protein
VLSITPPPSHHPSQSLCRPAAHCATIANCRCLSIAITPPPSIVIATAVHLALPPIVPLLSWRQLSAAHCATRHAAAISLLIVIALPYRHPLRRRCPLPPPPSITILPLLSIMIAAAVHLALPPIVPLLHWWQLSATHCAVQCTNAVLLPIVIALPSCRPLRRRCPLPLPPSIAVTPPSSIVIATSGHLALPPIAVLLRQRQSSTTHCAASPSLRCPATHCTAIAHCRCHRPLQSCRLHSSCIATHCAASALVLTLALELA